MIASDYLAESEPRRLALLVGNARYGHLSPLPGVVIDIDLMQAQLLALDFEVTRCNDIASVAQFEDDVLPAFRKQIQAGDLVVFYFSGHGFAHGANQYLALTDTDLRIDARRLADVAIAVDSLQGYLSRPLPGLLLLVLDACRSIGGFEIEGRPRSEPLLKQAMPERASGAARVNLLSALASRSGMPAIASDDVGDAARASLFTTELVAQLGLDDREFGAMFNDVSARVREASDEQQQPGLIDWSDTDLYLRVPPDLRGQQKEAWQVALSSRSRRLVQRFAYRFSISRHAAAARAWLAEHVHDGLPAVPAARLMGDPPPKWAALDGLRSALLSSAGSEQGEGVLLELIAPPLPGGLPELLHRAVVEAALSQLHERHLHISSVSLATAPSKDCDQAELREARLQHAIYMLEQAGIDRRAVTETQAAVGDAVRFRFIGQRR